MYSRSSNCIRTESTWIDKGFRGWILVQQCVSPPIVPRQIEARLYFFDSFWLFLPLFRLFFDRKRNNNQGEWMTKNANKIDRSWQNFFSLFFVAKKGRLFCTLANFEHFLYAEISRENCFGKISMEKKLQNFSFCYPLCLPSNFVFFANAIMYYSENEKNKTYFASQKHDRQQTLKLVESLGEDGKISIVLTSVVKFAHFSNV